MTPSIPQVILVTSAIVSLPMMMVLFIISRTYNQTIRGLKDCGFAILIMLLAVPLLIGRDMLTDFFSIVMANVLIIAGFIVMLKGTQKLASTQPISNLRTIGILCVALVLYAWFTYVDSNVTIRTLLFSTITGGILCASLYVSQKHLPPSSGKSLLAFSFTLIILTRLIRIGSVVMGLDQPKGVFDYSLPQVILLGIPALAVPLLTVGFIMVASDKIKSKIERENQVDDLTDTLNRKAGLNELTKEFNRSKRHMSKLVTMFIDLDGFKEINDQHGHLGGDKVLIDLASKASNCLRKTDLLFRYGGDEFVAILPFADIEQADSIAQRIHQLANESNPIAWTVSIGIAELKSEHNTIEDLLTRTDSALYQAKLSGKNKTVIIRD